MSKTENASKTFNPLYALVDLDLSAVALCGEGANSRANILLTKRREKQSMPKFETVDALLESLETENAALVTEHVSAAIAEKDTVISAKDTEIQALKAQLEGAAATEPETDPTEDLLKHASPEIRTELEKLRGTVATLIDAQNADLANKRFTTCKAIPVPEADLKAVLKSASPATLVILEKAAHAIEEGLLMGKGKATDDTFANVSSANSAYDKLSKSATDISTKEGITFEAAFIKACELAPDVYKTYAEGVSK